MQTPQSDIVTLFIEFMSSRGKGNGRVLSAADLHNLVGKSRLELHEHDLYVMGRSHSKEVMWSILRIESNTTAENKIQGKLGVRYLHGHGRERAGTDALQLTFPEGIRRFTTDDSVGFKHRSAFYVGGKFYRLQHLEHLCNIRVMSAADQIQLQSTTSIKRHSRTPLRRAKKRAWAHVSQERCRENQKKKILKMMIPYWHNSSDFFNVFMMDIGSACEEAKASLGPAYANGDGERESKHCSQPTRGTANICSSRSSSSCGSGHDKGLVVW
ncbi:unnamed protein product [Ectocarpus sp. 6 AP-2014]